MEHTVEAYYRKIFSDLKLDYYESRELVTFLERTNPPSAKILWLRATAFRIGSEYVTTNPQLYVALLRAIHAIVHAIEVNCMEPKPTNVGTGWFDEHKVAHFFNIIYADLNVDRAECQELVRFFTHVNPPPKDKLIFTRTCAFQVAGNYMSNCNRMVNVQLLKCINTVVNAFEQSCLQPRKFTTVPPSVTTSIAARVENYYRRIYSDLSVNYYESQGLKDFLERSNPPPAKVLWLRATAFRIGTEFISTNHAINLALLRAVHSVVHAIETNRMEPKPGPVSSGWFDDQNILRYFRSLYADLTIDRSENQELFRFFSSNPPPKDKLIFVRSCAFKVAADYFSNCDRMVNVRLLKCANAVVNAFEMTCLQPRPQKVVVNVHPDWTGTW